MDFDIGTIFYIVVTIAIVIIGALNKKKKPVSKASSKEGGTALEEFFRRMEGSVSGVQDQTENSTVEFDDEVIMESPVYEETETRTPVKESEDSGIYSDFTGVYEPGAQISMYDAQDEGMRTTDGLDIMHVIELEEEAEMDFNEIIEDFDLRKAVIYSIIIDKEEY